MNLVKYKKNIKGISSAALRKMEQYNWPGNVRELQHSVERAVILSDSNILQPTDFMLTKPSDLNTENSFESYNIEEVEKEVIQRVLRKNNGNISAAAKELGLTRASLYRRLGKYDL